MGVGAWALSLHRPLPPRLVDADAWVEGVTGARDAGGGILPR